MLQGRLIARQGLITGHQGGRAVQKDKGKDGQDSTKMTVP